MSKFKILLGLFLLILSTGCAQRKVEPVQTDKDPACTATREYVTSLEYLRDRKEFSLNESQMRELASKISHGCSGAASRFIRVTNTLMKATVHSKEAVETGLSFTAKSDGVTDAFLAVFRSSYASDELDMDLPSAIEMSRSLSVEFDGNHDMAMKDFKRMVKYCVDNNDLHMTRRDCGRFSARIAKLGEKSAVSVAQAYIDGFEFLISKRGAELPADQAMKIAEELVSISGVSVTNFIQAYRYAVSKSGLGLASGEALNFAKQMANRTTPSKRERQG